MKEVTFFNHQTNATAEYFEKWLYPRVNPHLIYEENNLPVPIYDELHDILSTSNLAKHNCIGCNLYHVARIINKFLQLNKCEGDLGYYLMNYTLLFYLQAERLGVIYKEIGFISNGKFDWSQFPVLQNIKYWANFFKHPKAFMFLHHPTFHITSYKLNPNFLFDGIIDNEFVKNYFSGEKEKKNIELSEKLSNKNWKVFFPDLLITTKELCNEFEKIISIIKSDESIIKKLVENYSR